MTYDLIVWPVDRALTVEEAIHEVEHLGSSFQIGIGHEKRLDAFVEAMHERYPGLDGHHGQPPFEFDVMRKHVFVACPDSAREEVAGVVAETAWGTGVAVFDPQREVVGLPSPYTDAPLDVAGINAFDIATDEAST